MTSKALLLTLCSVEASVNVDASSRLFLPSARRNVEPSYKPDSKALKKKERISLQDKNSIKLLRDQKGVFKGSESGPVIRGIHRLINKADTRERLVHSRRVAPFAITRRIKRRYPRFTAESRPINRRMNHFVHHPRM